jgi:HEAT repeat protein
MDDTFPVKYLYTPRILVLALVLLFAPGCNSFQQGTTARSFLNHTRDPDPNVRYQAYANLARVNAYDNQAQRTEAVELLTKRLQTKQESLAARAVICRTLGSLHEPGARPALIAAINDPEPLIREEACRALGKVGIEEDAVLLNKIAGVDQYLDCRVAALDGLADLKPQDTRVLQSLVMAMEDESPAIRLGAVIALQKCSGKDFGVETGPWKKYVEERMSAESASGKAVQIASQSKPAIPANQVRQTRVTTDGSVPPPVERTPESWTSNMMASPGTVNNPAPMPNPR